VARIRPISFGERPGPEPYNASEVVALADSRFLFCDNNVSDALFEFRLDPEGVLDGPLRRRPIEGLAPGAIDDIEGLEIVERAGRRFIFATSSLCLKPRKRRHRKKSKRGKVVAAREAILRIAPGPRDRLRGEIIPDFRPWLIERVKSLEKAATYLPDDGGLNVEALSWDPRTESLLFGLRTPLQAGRPVLLRVRPRNFDGPWTLDNLELLDPLPLDVPKAHGELGLRSMSLDQKTGVSLITLGNPTSASRAPFRLYSWDGNPHGELRYYDRVRFHRRMKVEGVTRGTIGGRNAIVFVDDGGGYQFLWADDERLATSAPRSSHGRAPNARRTRRS
jgi:hypothetical protein